jgi:hypothetical protein
VTDTLPSSSELDAARRLRRYFTALTEAGFSRDEALQLLIALVVADQSGGFVRRVHADTHSRDGHVTLEAKP